MEQGWSDERKHAIGRAVQRAREDAGLSQPELAQQMGVTPQAVSEWELGKNHIKAAQLDRVATVLGKPVEYFYGKPVPLASELVAVASQSARELSPQEQEWFTDLLRSRLHNRRPTEDRRNNSPLPHHKHTDLPPSARSLALAR